MAYRNYETLDEREDVGDSPDETKRWIPIRVHVDGKFRPYAAEIYLTVEDVFNTLTGLGLAGPAKAGQFLYTNQGVAVSPDVTLRELRANNPGPILLRRS